MKTKPVRPTKGSYKKTVVDNETGRIEEAEVHGAKPLFQTGDVEFEAAYADATPLRKLVAWVLALGGAVMTGTLWGMFLNALIVAAVTLTGSALLGLIIYCVGLVISFYAGFIVGGATFRYIIVGGPERHWEMVKAGVNSLASKVSGWMNSGKEVSHA